MSKCSICGSTSDLNTIVSLIDANGLKTDHIICDLHYADTLGEIREKCSVANQEILELIEKARQLGLQILPPDMSHTTTKSGLLLAESPKPTPAPLSVEKPERAKKPAEIDSGPEFIDTSLLDNNRPMSSVGGGSELGPIDSFSSISLDGLQDKLPPDARKGVAKMALVDGRAGQKLMIPEQRKDGTGTTTIQIVKVTDDQLQENFKRMADDSRGDNVPNFARSGYSNTTRSCPFCRGEGIVSKQMCPKCKGSGIISTYS